MRVTFVLRVALVSISIMLMVLSVVLGFGTAKVDVSGWKVLCLWVIVNGYIVRDVYRERKIER